MDKRKTLFAKRYIFDGFVLFLERIGIRYLNLEGYVRGVVALNVFLT